MTDMATLKGTDLVEVLYEITLAHSEETHGKDYQEKCKKAMSDAIIQWARDNLSIGGRHAEAIGYCGHSIGYPCTCKQEDEKIIQAESGRPLRGATARMGATPRPAADFITEAGDEADRRAKQK